MKWNKKLKQHLLTSFLCMMIVLMQICGPITIVCASQEKEISKDAKDSEIKSKINKNNTEGQEMEEAAEDENVIRVSNEKDFLKFAENCKYDAWSIGKTIELMADLNFTDLDFEGVAYFNGTFHGNGHTIKNFSMRPKGSNFGFFRYIGELGKVSEVKFIGAVIPSGTQDNIGGIAGVNYGTIEHCSFKGNVSGQDMVGGLAGANKGTGKIVSSNSDAIIIATNYTGGICGKNEGLISGCSSKSSVNVEELEPSLDLGGMDFSSLNLTQTVVTRNNMGGIAGESSGIITNCRNKGDIGFIHTGYNVGGIAGSQSGVILLSENEGVVYGRKDVGGIVGQAKPYVESEYLEDKIKKTKEDVDRLSNTLNGISSSLHKTSEDARKYVDSLTSQYEASVGVVADNVNALSDAYSGDSAEVQGYINNINQALGQIQSIQSSTEELTAEQAAVIEQNLLVISENLEKLQQAAPETASSAQQAINNIMAQMQDTKTKQTVSELAASIDLAMQQIGNAVGITADGANGISENLGTIQDNIENFEGSFSDTGAAADNLTDSISDQMNHAGIKQDIGNLADTLDSGVQSVTNGIDSAIDQLGQIADSVSDDMGVLMGEEQYVTDISSVKTAENTDGVVSGCTNRGEINGDLNVGGIAGTMNLEYEGDPEFDIDLTQSTSTILRSTINGVIIHCTNYGSVLGKKNCVGGIVGLQELGFVYEGQAYGDVRADAGDYLGGIAGKSSAAIEKSYSLCNISGNDYVGGICGSGYTVKESISICDIESEGEYLGGIAGERKEDGTVKGNLFVSDSLEGIDGISYAGAAEKISYGQAVEQEDAPKGFERVTAVFKAGDEVLAQKEVVFGGSITEKDFPVPEEKEGYYVKWPSQEGYRNITKNVTVEAEYIPWTQSIASLDVTENEKPRMLISGEFFEDSVLELTEAEGPDHLHGDEKTAYAYAWNIVSGREKDFETVEAHVLIPGEAEEVQLWVQAEQGWKQMEAWEDGSYLVADIPYGASFAVVTLPENSGFSLWVLGAGLLLLAICLILRYGKSVICRQ